MKEPKMFKKKMMCLWLFVAFFSLNGVTFAGDLEPAKPPAPTMKTLDEIPPTWSQILTIDKRFKKVLNNGAGVLDNETGLVWERSPSKTGGDNDDGKRKWWQAHYHCLDKVVGGRKGWYVPSIEQLASLVDTTQTNPALPDLYEFIFVATNIKTDRPYWSATTDIIYTVGAWAVDFYDGEIESDWHKTDNKLYVWCVRGSHGIDGVQ